MVYLDAVASYIGFDDLFDFTCITSNSRTVICTTYNDLLSFMDLVLSFFRTIFAFHVVAGISLGTILLYNFLLVVIFTAFARRG